MVAKNKLKILHGTQKFYSYNPLEMAEYLRSRKAISSRELYTLKHGLNSSKKQETINKIMMKFKSLKAHKIKRGNMLKRDINHLHVVDDTGCAYAPRVTKAGHKMFNISADVAHAFFPKLKTHYGLELLKEQIGKKQQKQKDEYSELDKIHF